MTTFERLGLAVQGHAGLGQGLRLLLARRQERARVRRADRRVKAAFRAWTRAVPAEPVCR